MSDSSAPANSLPTISLSLSLSPIPHSYSSPNPPTLSITATSNATRPLTLLTWHNALYPRLALHQNGYSLKDSATSTPIRQGTIQLSRGPIQRRINSLDEVNFLTLLPDVPVTESIGFGYPIEPNGPPLPKGHEGRMRPAARGQRVERSVCGVDGLEVGKKYVVGFSEAGLKVGWWRWGTKEEVLEPEDSRDWNLGWSEEAFLMEVEGGEVEFEVVE